MTRTAAPTIGLWPATSFVVGHTIAVGIFLTPAETIGSLASPALTTAVWTLCGALALAGLRATALTALIASALVLLGSFQQIVAFFICTSFGLVALAAAALFIVRRRVAESAFRTPGYPLTSGLFVLLVGTVVVVVAVNRPWQAGAGFVLLLSGLPAHSLFISRRTAADAISQGASQ
jgi:APA family basic amino acid/polyamine antiporter